MLILTDDEFGSPPESLGLRDKAIKIVAVVIGGDGVQAKKFCDKVICVEDLISQKGRLQEAIKAIV